MTDPKAYLIIDAGGTYLKSAILTEAGSVLENSFFSTPAFSDGSSQQITDAYNKTVIQGLHFTKKNMMVFSGIGIATPGPFDYDNGILLMKHKFQEMYGISLRELINTIPGVSCKIPIRFMHDANAVLAGEMWKGNAIGYANTAVVTLGTGIGFAFSQNGVIQCNEMGGPLLSVYKQSCNDGILEDYVSKRGILKIYQRKKGIKNLDGLNVADLAKQAEEGDEICISIFQEVGEILTSAIESILLQNDICCLLLGGQISRSFYLIEDSLKQGLEGVESLQHIAMVKNIDHAALLGAFQHLKTSI
jgi:glucokinase